MIDGHGDDFYKYTHPIESNFSSNVPARVNLDGLKSHLNRCVNGCGGAASSLSAYPEPEPYTLEALLAETYHLPMKGVCVTNGATEAIYLIAQTFGDSRSAVLQPTFSEYADACKMHRHQVVSFYRLPSEKEAYRLPDTLQLCWLCNPNNPTGHVTDKKELVAVIERNPHVHFVIDQSYEYFTLHELFTPEEAAQFPNVFLLHSMTKRYAIPGLRLGYVTANPLLLQRVRMNRMPWAVNQLAIEAGIYLLKNHTPSIHVEQCLQEARRLREALQSLGGLEVMPTETHYMLVRLHAGKAADLKKFLVEKHGLLIRDASNFDGLDERCFRIATQTREENEMLVKAIENWLNER